MATCRAPARRIDRREFLRKGLRGSVAAALGPVLTRCARQVEFQGPARHVIVVSLDTTRVDHLGCFAETCVRTPRIDELARESILFPDHVTPITTTLASHVSLFTGKYPHDHGVPRNGFVIHRDNLTLPQILSAAGFHTAAFLGSFALDGRFGFARGFDHFDQDFDVLVGQRGADQNQRSASQVTQAAISYLEKNGIPRNLFLFVHYFDPHHPYAPPSPFDSAYGAAGVFGDSERRRHPLLQFGPRPEEDERRMFLYAGEVSYMDAEVGRLMDYLRARRVLDDAVLTVTSDHGEHFGDPPSGRAFDHGWTVHEPEMRAAWLLRLPRGEAGGRRWEESTSNIDVLPSLLRYLGLPAPDGIGGEALDVTSPLPTTRPRVLFAEATKPWQKVEVDPRWFNLLKQRCARRFPYKYVRTPYLRTEELYDLRDEKRERRNLLVSPTPESSAVAGELRKALDAWDASARPLPSHFEDSQQKETIERLRALGYVTESKCLRVEDVA